MFVENYVENDFEAARGAQNTRTRMNRGHEEGWMAKPLKYNRLSVARECVSNKDKPS